jgi:pyruvate,water dikinase
VSGGTRRAGVVSLAAAHHEATFGGKAVSLGAAIRAGLPVPPGVALAAALVDELATGVAAITDVLDALDEVPAARLAVRSSAVGEDSRDTSFAGQHATKLNVSRAAVAEAVRVVWESARSESALAYRARQGLAAAPQIGAVVQMLVEPRAAGVLFTRNPVSGADERMIEAAWGLGEAVVSGAVLPDRFRLDKDGGVIEAVPGEKDVKVWYGQGEGTVEIAVPPELHHEPCVTAAELGSLHELAERCCCVWGPHLDIEWALGEDRRVYLLQCRPITTLRGRA